MNDPSAGAWQAVLNAQTENELFIRISAFLQDRDLAGFKCSSAFEIVGAMPCPSFKFTYFMVIGHPYRDGIGWFRQPVWVFTLAADGRLTWDAMHFKEPIDYDKYKTFTQRRIVGLENIKCALRDLNGWLPRLSREIVEQAK
ncbi:MAG: hypothetical protein ACYDBJ_15770 [Aggregatilineales bacterium]